MGVFSKIKEMIRRSRTPKLEEGNQQNGENSKRLQETYTIQLSSDQSLMITAIQKGERMQYSNGEITDLMIAKVIKYKNGEHISSLNQESVAFEIPSGTPIDDIVLNKISQYYMYERNMPDNNKNCMYLGKLSHDPYDLGNNNKSAYVEKYINEKIAPQIEREKQEQIQSQLRSYRETQERDARKQREFVAGMQEEYKEYVQQQNEIKNQRIKNPYLNQIGEEYVSKDGMRYKDYEGINILNGDFLRLRKMNKVGKDINTGTYVYTGYVSTTANENSAEILSKDITPEGIPICFTTDRKIEEIMQSEDPRDKVTLLSLLSEKSLDYENNNGYLNYIGKIDRYNRIDRNLAETSEIIHSTVTRVQKNFYQQRIQVTQKHM